MRYRVELDDLLAFVDKLEAFQRRAEAITAGVDGRVNELHTTWSGGGADAHRARHDEWMSAAAEMREAVADLRAAARNAHLHYTDAATMNLEMLR
jgi:WXG100 family type VII secretion target